MNPFETPEEREARAKDELDSAMRAGVNGPTSDGSPFVPAIPDVAAETPASGLKTIDKTGGAADMVASLEADFGGGPFDVFDRDVHRKERLDEARRNRSATIDTRPSDEPSAGASFVPTESEQDDYEKKVRWHRDFLGQTILPSLVDKYGDSMAVDYVQKNGKQSRIRLGEVLPFLNDPSFDDPQDAGKRDLLDGILDGVYELAGKNGLIPKKYDAWANVEKSRRIPAMNAIGVPRWENGVGLWRNEQQRKEAFSRRNEVAEASHYQVDRLNYILRHEETDVFGTSWLRTGATLGLESEESLKKKRASLDGYSVEDLRRYFENGQAEKDLMSGDASKLKRFDDLNKIVNRRYGELIDDRTWLGVLWDAAGRGFTDEAFLNTWSFLRGVAGLVDSDMARDRDFWERLKDAKTRNEILQPRYEGPNFVLEAMQSGVELAEQQVPMLAVGGALGMAGKGVGALKNIAQYGSAAGRGADLASRVGALGRMKRYFDATFKAGQWGGTFVRNETDVANQMANEAMARGLDPEDIGWGEKAALTAWYTAWDGFFNPFIKGVRMRIPGIRGAIGTTPAEIPPPIWTGKFGSSLKNWLLRTAKDVAFEAGQEGVQQLGTNLWTAERFGTFGTAEELDENGNTSWSKVGKDYWDQTREIAGGTIFGAAGGHAGRWRAEKKYDAQVIKKLEKLPLEIFMRDATEVSDIKSLSPADRLAVYESLRGHSAASGIKQKLAVVEAAEKNGDANAAATAKTLRDDLARIQSANAALYNRSTAAGKNVLRRLNEKIGDESVEFGGENLRLRQGRDGNRRDIDTSSLQADRDAKLTVLDQHNKGKRRMFTWEEAQSDDHPNSQMSFTEEQDKDGNIETIWIQNNKDMRLPPGVSLEVNRMDGETNEEVIARALDLAQDLANYHADLALLDQDTADFARTFIGNLGVDVSNVVFYSSEEEIMARINDLVRRGELDRSKVNLLHFLDEDGKLRMDVGGETIGNTVFLRRGANTTIGELVGTIAHESGAHALIWNNARRIVQEGNEDDFKQIFDATGENREKFEAFFNDLDSLEEDDQIDIVRSMLNGTKNAYQVAHILSLGMRRDLSAAEKAVVKEFFDDARSREETVAYTEQVDWGTHDDSTQFAPLPGGGFKGRAKAYIRHPFRAKQYYDFKREYPAMNAIVERMLARQINGEADEDVMMDFLGALNQHQGRDTDRAPQILAGAIENPSHAATALDILSQMTGRDLTGLNDRDRGKIMSALGRVRELENSGKTKLPLAVAINRVIKEQIATGETGAVVDELLNMLRDEAVLSSTAYDGNTAFANLQDAESAVSKARKKNGTERQPTVTTASEPAPTATEEAPAPQESVPAPVISNNPSGTPTEGGEATIRRNAEGKIMDPFASGRGEGSLLQFVSNELAKIGKTRETVTQDELDSINAKANKIRQDAVDQAIAELKPGETFQSGLSVGTTKGRSVPLLIRKRQDGMLEIQVLDRHGEEIGWDPVSSTGLAARAILAEYEQQASSESKSGEQTASPAAPTTQPAPEAPASTPESAPQEAAAPASAEPEPTATPAVEIPSNVQAAIKGKASRAVRGRAFKVETASAMLREAQKNGSEALAATEDALRAFANDNKLTAKFSDVEVTDSKTKKKVSLRSVEFVPQISSTTPNQVIASERDEERASLEEGANDRLAAAQKNGSDALAKEKDKIKAEAEALGLDVEFKKPPRSLGKASVTVAEFSEKGANPERETAEEPAPAPAPATSTKPKAKPVQTIEEEFATGYPGVDAGGIDPSNLDPAYIPEGTEEPEIPKEKSERGVEEVSDKFVLDEKLNPDQASLLQSAVDRVNDLQEGNVRATVLVNGEKMEVKMLPHSRDKAYERVVKELKHDGVDKAVIAALEKLSKTKPKKKSDDIARATLNQKIWRDNTKYATQTTVRVILSGSKNWTSDMRAWLDLVKERRPDIYNAAIAQARRLVDALNDTGAREGNDMFGSGEGVKVETTSRTLPTDPNFVHQTPKGDTSPIMTDNRKEGLRRILRSKETRDGREMVATDEGLFERQRTMGRQRVGKVGEGRVVQGPVDPNDKAELGSNATPRIVPEEERRPPKLVKGITRVYNIKSIEGIDFKLLPEKLRKATAATIKKRGRKFEDTDFNAALMDIVDAGASIDELKDEVRAFAFNAGAGYRFFRDEGPGGKEYLRVAFYPKHGGIRNAKQHQAWRNYAEVNRWIAEAYERGPEALIQVKDAIADIAAEEGYEVEFVGAGEDDAYEAREAIFHPLGTSGIPTKHVAKDNIPKRKLTESEINHLRDYYKRNGEEAYLGESASIDFIESIGDKESLAKAREGIEPEKPKKKSLAKKEATEEKAEAPAPEPEKPKKGTRRMAPAKKAEADEKKPEPTAPHPAKKSKATAKESTATAAPATGKRGLLTEVEKNTLRAFAAKGIENLNDAEKGEFVRLNYKNPKEADAVYKAAIAAKEATGSKESEKKPSEAAPAKKARVIAPKRVDTKVLPKSILDAVSLVQDNIDVNDDAFGGLKTKHDYDAFWRAGANKDGRLTDEEIDRDKRLKSKFIGAQHSLAEDRAYDLVRAIEGYNNAISVAEDATKPAEERAAARENIDNFRVAAKTVIGKEVADKLFAGQNVAKELEELMGKWNAEAEAKGILGVRRTSLKDKNGNLRKRNVYSGQKMNAREKRDAKQRRIEKVSFTLDEAKEFRKLVHRKYVTLSESEAARLNELEKKAPSDAKEIREGRKSRIELKLEHLEAERATAEDAPADAAADVLDLIEDEDLRENLVAERAKLSPEDQESFNAMFAEDPKQAERFLAEAKGKLGIADEATEEKSKKPKRRIGNKITGAEELKGVEKYRMMFEQLSNDANPDVRNNAASIVAARIEDEISERELGWKAVPQGMREFLAELQDKAAPQRGEVAERDSVSAAKNRARSIIDGVIAGVKATTFDQRGDYSLMTSPFRKRVWWALAPFVRDGNPSAIKEIREALHAASKSYGNGVSTVIKLADQRRRDALEALAKTAGVAAEWADGIRSGRTDLQSFESHFELILKETPEEDARPLKPGEADEIRRRKIPSEFLGHEPETNERDAEFLSDLKAPGDRTLADLLIQHRTRGETARENTSGTVIDDIKSPAALAALIPQLERAAANSPLAKNTKRAQEARDKLPKGAATYARLLDQAKRKWRTLTGEKSWSEARANKLGYETDIGTVKSGGLSNGELWLIGAAANRQAEANAGRHMLEDVAVNKRGARGIGAVGVDARDADDYEVRQGFQQSAESELVGRRAARPNGRQHQAGIEYPDAGAEIQGFQQSAESFSVQAERLLKKRRPDVDARTVINDIKRLFETPKERKISLHWFVRGGLALPEDSYKVADALSVAEKAKVDPFAYKSPDELLLANKQFKPTARPIDPATVPELSDARDEGDGIVSYLVQDDQQGQAAMRRIIDTHWGEDANPWCLLARSRPETRFTLDFSRWLTRNKDMLISRGLIGRGHDQMALEATYKYETGKEARVRINPNLDDAWDYWQEYSALPKRVAFKNGKLLAFMATSDTRLFDAWSQFNQDEKIGQVDFSQSIADVFGDAFPAWLENDGIVPDDRKGEALRAFEEALSAKNELEGAYLSSPDIPLTSELKKRIIQATREALFSSPSEEWWDRKDESHMDLDWARGGMQQSVDSEQAAKRTRADDRADAKAASFRERFPLMAVHGLSISSLKSALDAGAFVMPSTAVALKEEGWTQAGFVNKTAPGTDSEVDDFYADPSEEDYKRYLEGSAFVLMPKAAIQNRGELYTGDAFTPTINTLLRRAANLGLADEEALSDESIERVRRRFDRGDIEPVNIESTRQRLVDRKKEDDEMAAFEEAYGAAYDELYTEEEPEEDNRFTHNPELDHFDEGKIWRRMPIGEATAVIIDKAAADYDRSLPNGVIAQLENAGVKVVEVDTNDKDAVVRAEQENAEFFQSAASEAESKRKPGRTLADDGRWIFGMRKKDINERIKERGDDHMLIGLRDGHRKITMDESFAMAAMKTEDEREAIVNRCLDASRYGRDCVLAADEVPVLMAAELAAEFAWEDAVKDLKTVMDEGKDATYAEGIALAAHGKMNELIKALGNVKGSAGRALNIHKAAMFSDMSFAGIASKYLDAKRRATKDPEAAKSVTLTPEELERAKERADEFAKYRKQLEGIIAVYGEDQAVKALDSLLRTPRKRRLGEGIPKVETALEKARKKVEAMEDAAPIDLADWEGTYGAIQDLVRNIGDAILGEFKKANPLKHMGADAFLDRLKTECDKVFGHLTASDGSRGGLTREEYRDLYTDADQFGKHPPAPEDPVRAEIRRMLNATHMIYELEAVKKDPKQFPIDRYNAKRGTSLTEEDVDTEIERLKRAHDDALRASGLSNGGPDAKTMPLDVEKMRVSNRIEELRHAIDNHERIVRETRQPLVGDEELANMKRELAELQRDYAMMESSMMTDEEKLAKLEQGLEKRLESRKRELERLNGGASFNTARMSQDGKRYLSNTKRMDEISKELSEIEKNILELRALKNPEFEMDRYAAKRIMETKRRLKNAEWKREQYALGVAPASIKRKNDYQGWRLRPEAREVLKQLDEAQELLERDQEEFIWKQSSRASRNFNRAMGLVDTLRTYRASGDISGLGVQLAPYLLMHPEMLFKRGKEAVRSLFDEKFYDELREKIKADPRLYTVLDKMGVKLTDIRLDGLSGGKTEDVFRRQAGARWLGAIADSERNPYLAASERGFNSPIIMARWEMATAVLDHLTQKFGSEQDIPPQDLKTAGRLINAMTGKGDLFDKRGESAWKNLLWAPGRLAGQIQTITLPLNIMLGNTPASDALKSYIKKEYIGKPIANAAKLAAALWLVHMLLKDDDDDDPFIEIDPTMPQFGKVKIGKRFFSILGGEEAMPRLITKVAGDFLPETIGRRNFYGNEVKSNGYKVGDTMDTIVQFARGRLNPALSGLLEWQQGKKYTGETIDKFRMGHLFEDNGMAHFLVFDNLLPLSWTDVYDVVMDGLGARPGQKADAKGVAGIVPLTILALAGVQGQNYGDTAFKRYEARFDKFAKDVSDSSWLDLSEKRALAMEDKNQPFVSYPGKFERLKKLRSIIEKGETALRSGKETAPKGKESRRVPLTTEEHDYARKQLEKLQAEFVDLIESDRRH